MNRWIVLGRQRGAEIEVRSPIELPIEHLRPMAEVALKEGFEIMWEFSEEPDMTEIGRRLQDPEVGVADMPTMKRLWVLKSA